MDYRKIYKNLITRACNENRVKGKSYYEQHHIIPEFMFKLRKRAKNVGHLDGNPNDPQNLVLLTAREHFIAHVLLYKIYKHTRYEYQCGASLVLFYTHFGKLNYRFAKGGFSGQSKKYEHYRKIGLESISMARKGTMPVKDSLTNLSIGSVPTNHPKVLSGEWVHVTKGRKITSEERKNRKPTNGKDNSNFKEMTEERRHRLFNMIINKCIVENHLIKNLLERNLKIEFKNDFKKISSVWITNNFGSLYELIETLNIEKNTSFEYDVHFRSEYSRNLTKEKLKNNRK